MEKENKEIFYKGLLQQMKDEDIKPIVISDKSKITHDDIIDIMEAFYNAIPDKVKHPWK